MSSITKLLDTRKEIKSRKPEFERQDSNIFKQFEGKWRRPKGIHSKLRRGFRGHKAAPSIGYSSPRAVSGLTKKGLKMVLISNLNDFNKIKNDCVAVISSKVGIKKKLEILKYAKEKKLNVSGVKDFDSYINKI